MKLTLHVGLPKTATTTIQHVLDEMKPDLARRGVLYPGSTRWQKGLVQRVQSAPPDAVAGPGSLAELLELIAEEMRTLRLGHVVLSCERMSLLGPASIRRLQEAIATCLPKVREVRVLAYVRDPVEFSTSLCQQRMKQGTDRLADFLANPWPLSFRSVLEKYVGIFGLTAVSVRSLQREQLVNGDVVEDFLAEIGLSGVAVPGPRLVLNKSLSRHGAQVADLLADRVPHSLWKGRRKHLVRQLLQAILGPRFSLPEAVQADVIARSRGDLNYVRKHWGLEFRPVISAPPEAGDLSPEEVMALAVALLDDLERIVTGSAEAERGDGA